MRSLSLINVFSNTDLAIHKIITTPANAKNFLKLVLKIFVAMDIKKYGKELERGSIIALKGGIQVLDFYSSYKSIKFWINPFNTKETLDQTALLDSLKQSLPNQRDESPENRDKRINQIFQEIMAKGVFVSKEKFQEAIKATLIEKQYTNAEITRCFQNIVIKQKTRTVVQVFSQGCFTVTNLGTTLLTLGKWQSVDLSNIALKLGKYRVCAFAINLGADVVLGTVGSVGLIFTLSEACYRFGVKSNTYIYAADKKVASKEVKNAFLDILSNGTELVSTAAPLLLTISPLGVLGLAIIAKGTAVISVVVADE